MWPRPKAASRSTRWIHSAPRVCQFSAASTGSRLSASRGAGRTVVRGRPSEIALYLFGRKEQADVEVTGDAAGTVDETPLGL